MRRRSLLLLTLAALVPRSSARAEEPVPELRAVLQRFSAVEALSARFREEKRMALLAQPLSSEGVLHYQKPRLLVRHTEKPRRSSMLLNGDVLTFGDDKSQQRIELSTQPAVRVLVDTFVSVLAGDHAALTKSAELKLEPRSGGAFRIVVTPKDERLKRIVRTMAFEGQGGTLSRMELTDATGDLTVTTFSEVKARKSFAPAERLRLFRIGAP